MKISTYLMKRPGRFIECQWRDPVTGKLKTRSTGTHKDKEAVAFQVDLETKLNAEYGDDVTDELWSVVADRYEDEVLSSRANSTLRKWRGTRNKLEAIIDPQFLTTLNNKRISQFAKGLRAQGLAALSVKSHLAYLRTCLHWCQRQGLIRMVPTFEMPKRVNKMKGRPITTEEYERMLAAIPDVIDAEYVAGWKFLLEGLWLSGLRLGEALRLTWNPSGFCVNLAAGVPRLKIEVNEQKSTKAELLPLAPDFGEFLLNVPPAERRGRVFRPQLYGQAGEMRLDTCSKKIQEIGKEARVVVEEKAPKSGKTEVRKKYASAHDFRRAFGKRWRQKVKSDILKQLMRHASIVTTETFYDDTSAAEVEAAIHEALNPAPNKSPNISQNPEVSIDSKP